MSIRNFNEFVQYLRWILHIWNDKTKSNNKLKKKERLNAQAINDLKLAFKWKIIYATLAGIGM